MAPSKVVYCKLYCINQRKQTQGSIRHTHTDLFAMRKKSFFVLLYNGVIVLNMQSCKKLGKIYMIPAFS